MGTVSDLDLIEFRDEDLDQLVTLEISPFVLDFRGALAVLDEEMESTGDCGIVSSGSGLVVFVVDGMLQDLRDGSEYPLTPGRYVLDVRGLKSETLSEIAATRH